MEQITCQWVYDTKGNMLKKISPDGSVCQWEYDSDGNMTKVIYPSERAYRYEYDSRGNMTKKTFPSGVVRHWDSLTALAAAIEGT